MVVDSSYAAMRNGHKRRLGKRQKSCIARLVTICSLFVLARVCIHSDWEHEPSRQRVPTAQHNYTKSDERKTALLQRLDRVQKVCGGLCKNALDKRNWIKNSSPVRGANIRLTTAKDVNCDALMKSDEIDAADTSVPYPIPKELIEYYSIGDSVEIRNTKRYRNVFLGRSAQVPVWTEAMVEEQIRMAEQGTLAGTYGADASQYVQNKLKNLNLVDKHVLVIGSSKPWLEAICISLGAAQVTTLEYGRVQSEHPQISTMTPDVMRSRYAAGTLGTFDVIATHSSVEHSGLGRYGDALNPWGDIVAIARAWCVASPDASMYLGVNTGADQIGKTANQLFE